MPNQPNKIFRILDDINWDQVTSTELKTLMNRNISSVNIKYGYEYIFPLIPIIIMNGEDYKSFRQHFADIWEFIERNAVIYPPQKGKNVIEETDTIFTNQEVSFIESDTYLFSKIMDVNKLKDCNMNNLNEWIKKELNQKESWKYDTRKYIQLPTKEDIKIPNPELSKKTILKQYEEFLLQKKVKEMNKSEEGNDEKKPKEPWYKNYKTNQRRKPVKTRFDELNFNDDEKYYEHKKKKKYDDYEDSDDDEDMSSEDSEGSSDSSEPEEGFEKGFIQI